MLIQERRKGLTTISLGILILIVVVSLAFTYPTIYPTGTTIYKPDKCWNGFTLVPYEGGGVTLLIDMNGNVVHKWNIGAERARLTPNGHLVLIKGGDNKVREYNWQGNLVWEYEVPVGPHHEIRYPTPGIVHHDLQRVPNGNTIFLYHETVPPKYMKLVTNPARRAVKIIGDCICEVNKQKKIVWEWHEYKHLDLNNYSKLDGLNDWTHTNTVQVLPQNHWYKEGHKEFKPGNVLTCPRHLDTIMIIDRATKKVVWEYSGTYRRGLAHPHEPHMIEPGLPGAGNILIFDNGVGPRSHDGSSIVLEINPVTKKIVWKYERGKEFFSDIQSTEQRLPNGNTFIVESTPGRLFEVTPKGEIVWEYVMLPLNPNDLHASASRPHRYSYDYCPQLRVLPHPQELAVTPPKNVEWHLVPDPFLMN